MSDLLIGLLSALVATNQGAVLSNLVQEKTGLAVPMPNHNDPAEREYLRLLDADNAAQAEVDQWIKSSQVSPVPDSPVQKALLQGRIEKRLDDVKKAYEAFLERFPDHSRARLAYGSFLNDTQEEDAARIQWEKARELNPANPAAWNNLANYYGHNGQVRKAFEYYDQAIRLNPAESVYFQNLATSVYLFRKEAASYYELSLPAALDKAMALYHKALELDPENFILATEVAQTYYGIPPPQTGDGEADRKATQRLAEKALAAWRYALSLARDDIERQGILLHLARVQIKVGGFLEARRHLDSVTNAMFNATKQNLLQKLVAEEERSGP